MKLKKKFFNFCPTIFLVTLSLIFFHKFFLNRLIPIPTDITVGMYYPWLNSKWGNIVGVAVKNPLMSDIVSIIYQWRMTAINAIKSGNFPFWNPYYFLGMPLFANFQNSLINLTNLPFFLPIKTATAWGLMIYFQLLFSLFSAFIYLKSIGLKNISAFLGSIIFAFSLFNITWLEYGIHTYVASFLPLMLSTIEKKKFTLMSILIALQIYGGYPQYSIYSLIFITFYFLILHSNKNFKKILLFLIYIILGLSLAAPLLIPGLQLITRSIHSIDITAQTSNQGFLPLKNLFTAISPNFWGNPATSDYQGKGFYDNNAFYPGIFALLAFFYWLFNKKSKLVKFFLFSIPIVFLLAISNPISFFLKNNFGVIFSKNGISTRIFLISNLAFSVLSAFLIENLLNKKQAKA
ncbi:YfhO family protein, partial [Patescibacteria group bacterium]|nr:YfhO family protein [Patescibacteria group bacterium]